MIEILRYADVASGTTLVSNLLEGILLWHRNRDLSWVLVRVTGEVETRPSGWFERFPSFQGFRSDRWTVFRDGSLPLSSAVL